MASKRTIIWICLVFLVGSVAQAGSDPYSPTARGGFTPYANDHGAPIRFEYDRTANQWPTALSCLHPEEHKKSEPDITRLNWAAFRSNLDAEVCLFRLLDALGSVQQGRRWMEALRLHDIRLRKIRRSGNRLIQLCGTNAAKRTGRVLVPAQQSADVVAKYLYDGERFCSEWSLDGYLVSTSYAVDGLQEYPKSANPFLLPPAQRYRDLRAPWR